MTVLVLIWYKMGTKWVLNVIMTDERDGQNDKVDYESGIWDSENLG